MQHPAAVGSAIFLVLLVVVAVAAPLLAPYDPEFRDRAYVLAGPSAVHWLGTDDLGRDVLSRLIFATRVSLVVSVAVAALAFVIALPLGLVAGYRGGRVDNVIMRIVDAALSFPALVLALAIAGVLGPGVANTVLALAVVMAPGLVRVIRGQALAVRQETFIEASLSIGTPAHRIMLGRLLPNVRSVVIVQATYVMGAALLAEAALSYLGLGAPPPTPTWGNMLRRSYDTALFIEPVQVLAPAIAIAATVYAFNVFGDGLRDVLGVSRRQSANRRARRGLTSVDSSIARRRRDRSVLAASTTESLLQITGLSVDFVSGDKSTRRVVDNVSLAIRPGEIVGLVGESGSGKSVTSLSVMRLVPPHMAHIAEGRIELRGRNLLDLSLDEMRAVRGKEIGMIFQDPMSSLDPAFTVGDQLVEAQVVHGVPRKAARARAIEMIEMVGIPAAHERFSAYPHQLSGGMRQRVMIALALVNRPALLIADEPTTALDVTVQAEILDLLRRLQQELGMAILFITHDLGVVADLCDQVAVMYAGQLVEQRPVFNLFAEPKHPYTEGLLGAMPQLERRTSAQLTVIPGNVPIAGQMPTGCRFHPRCRFAISECATVAIPLADVSDGHVRCVRSEDLALNGAR
ncbi:dipeptide/oligopeptide/nickel ABC transporter permease/ATP-binding protein [Microbacterium sp. zg.B48]|uniref:dipeptide/oligopeptide/nickel ABC transporter permease/ATP-binding protein n=1 Tax=Microbacterium sp. zg.B48 TaxID=2969408 RepID=UPI00214CDA0D|nr:dipeptide/oligopeptide/nickel ABC transporter permease/ATP-binding protein [Microbacterium sp. zg.B48]MCR2764363.1 dipeptide/oligopeptide/nickel ABC transporter permease/ATP-binding protein [Microbacterium sp. zg.B48]